jgi:uncharacterized protein YdiU (UPF0061 family)
LAQGLPEVLQERLKGLSTDAQRAIQFARSTPGVDVALVGDLLEKMAANKVDYTLFFRRLSEYAANDGVRDSSARALFENPGDFDAWIATWRTRLSEERTAASERTAIMLATNPAYIPRNHRVEAVIAAAQERGDFAPFEELLEVLAAPFDERPQFASYANPPRPDEVVLQTFCGT